MSNTIERLSQLIEEIVEEKVAAILGEQQPQKDEPPAENLDEQLTPAQVAEKLNVHPGTLKRWRRNGTGPSFTKYTERAIRYALRDVLTFKEERKAKRERR